MNLSDVTAGELDERISYAFGRERRREHMDIGCDGLRERKHARGCLLVPHRRSNVQRVVSSSLNLDRA